MRKLLHKMIGLLALVALVLLALVKTSDLVAATPYPSILSGSVRIGAPCEGPSTMTGCVISLYDSTAQVNLTPGTVDIVAGEDVFTIPGVAVARGDTLWIDRACSAVEPVTIGGSFVGTAPGAYPSAPVEAVGTGTCAVQAGQPTGTILITTVAGS